MKSKPVQHRAKRDNKLERLVGLVVLENRQAVEDFLEEHNALIGTQDRELVRGVMMLIGIGGEEVFRDFLELHPHKELFMTETETESGGINDKEMKALLASPKKRKRKQEPPKMWSKTWVKLLALLLFLLLLFVLVYVFVKEK